jgi:GNAT superfamily N-acetyltransferase
MLSTLSKDADIPSRARLLPINLDDATECSVLHGQRILCGWGQDKIAAWRESMRKGERALFWIALPLEMRKDDVAILKRDAETEAFIPAGHVSLDKVDEPSPGMDPDPTLVAPDSSVLTVSSLFVHPVFTGCGLGRFALRECEQLAQQEPYGSTNCRCLSLWTLSERYAAGGEEGWDGLGRWERLGMAVPKRPTGPWYESLGYKKYKEEIRLRFGLPNDMMLWYGVFFRKEFQ